MQITCKICDYKGVSHNEYRNKETLISCPRCGALYARQPKSKNICAIFLQSVELSKIGLTEKSRIYREFAYAQVCTYEA